MSYNSPFTANVIQPTDVSFRDVTLSANTQLSWPINGNATDDYAARIMDVTATTTGLSLWMPPANQASVGQDALIRNIGSNTFTVKDYSGDAVICTIAAGEAQYVYITDNPDEYGTWGVIAFGAGASAADAGSLAGYGLLAISNTLNQSHPVSTFSSDATTDATYRAKTYVWGGGAGTLTLGDAATLGNNWFMLVRNGGTGTLTVSTSGTDLFDGASSVSLQLGDSCIICCSGTAFYSVGLGKSTQFNFTQLTKPVVTGTYTLTSNEAANVVLKFTGTLTGNVTIIVPQTVQVYYIQNATDGTINNYTLTITTDVSSSSSATIASNQQATLVCDSVNLFNANTVLAGSTAIGLIDGTVSSPSLYFGSEPTTGVFRGASGQFDIAVLGVLRLGVTALGIGVIGDVAATGDVSGVDASFTGTGNFESGIFGGTFV
jgi:hypothetical protein